MENLIIITNTENKKQILKDLSQNKLLYNIKFYSFPELKKNLYFDYNNNTIAYIIKNYHVNLNVAQVYLNNLYFLQDIPDKKIKFLISLKEELEKNNLLIKNPYFLNNIKNKKIILYGYNHLKPEEEIILQALNCNIITKKEEISKYIPTVYEGDNIEEEVEFVFYEISKLLHQNIPLSKIKIIANNEYNIMLKRYAKIYNIALNIEDNSSLYSTFIAEDFLANYDKMSIEANILSLSEKYTNTNDLINVINKSASITDKEIRKKFIINDLKKSYLYTPKYLSGIEIANIKDKFKDDEHVFLLGFNINSYPKVIKDEDYLSDNLKEKLNRNTSIIENRINKEILKEQLTSIKNLTITYKLHSKTGVFYPSLLIKELNLEVKKITISRLISYTKLGSSLEYAKSLDKLAKFNVITEDLGLYQNNLNIPYREYNNVFKGINKSKYQKSLKGLLNLAYTNMEMYNECSFRYYLSKVLKIDKYEENFKTILGTITHHILELAINKDIEIAPEIIKYVKDKEYILNKREFFYLEKLCIELKEVIKIIKEQEKHSKLNKYLFEEELYIYKDLDDINVTFKGLIDKVMYNEFNDKKVIAVVDYKTGNTKINLDNLKYGLDIQLPIYLYLLKKSSKFKDAQIVGFYIQKVLDKIPVISSKNIETIRKENLKLQGYSNKDEKLLELIDDEYENSSTIKDLKYKKNGEFSNKSKVLSTSEMNELTNTVEEKITECTNHILNAEFSINPKILDKKNRSCLYCKFKDICYKTKNDEVILGGEEDEMDGGTITSHQ